MLQLLRRLLRRCGFCMFSTCVAFLRALRFPYSKVQWNYRLAVDVSLPHDRWPLQGLFPSFAPPWSDNESIWNASKSCRFESHTGQNATVKVSVTCTTSVEWNWRHLYRWPVWVSMRDITGVVVVSYSIHHHQIHEITKISETLEVFGIEISSHWSDGQTDGQIEMQRQRQMDEQTAYG